MELTVEQKARVEKNVDLAHYLALDACRKYPRQEKDDLIAAAYEGLIRAAQRFEPERADVIDGVADTDGAFSGYARRLIWGSILESLRKEDRVPRRQRDSYKEFLALGHGHGRTPEELAALTGLDLKRVRLIIATVEQVIVPLNDFEEHSEEDGHYGGVHPTDPGDDVEGSALETRIRTSLANAFDELPEVQQVIVAYRFYLGWELSAVAEALEMRQSAVRTAYNEALVFLHGAMVREAV